MSVTIDNSGSSIEIKNNGALLVTMSGTQGPAGPPGDPADNTDWGDIEGTLSDQTDLQAALGLKADDSDLTAHTGDTDIHFGDAPSDGEQYARKDGAWEEVAATGDLAWGDITGTLSDQTDLQAALYTKYESGDSPTFDDLTLTGDISLSDGATIDVGGGTGDLNITGGDLNFDGQIVLGAGSFSYPALCFDDQSQYAPGLFYNKLDGSTAFIAIANGNTSILSVGRFFAGITTGGQGRGVGFLGFSSSYRPTKENMDARIHREATGHLSITDENDDLGTLELADIIASGDITQKALSADPEDPANGESVQWVSDGTDSGDDGDVMMRVADSSGNIKTVTLVDHDAEIGNGFADYNNTDSPTTIPADTWVTIPNDGLGAFSNSTYIPEGITRLMDTSTGEFDFSELALGDTVLIRNDFAVNPDTNNALLEKRYQLGTGGSVYTLETVMGRLDDGSGKDYRFSLNTDLIYMGDSNTRDNPVTLQIRLSTSGTVSNAGSVIQLIRK